LNPAAVKWSPRPISRLGSKVRLGATSPITSWPPTTNWSGLLLNPTRGPMPVLTARAIVAANADAGSATSVHPNKIFLSMRDLLSSTGAARLDGQRKIAASFRRAQPQCGTLARVLSQKFVVALNANEFL